MKTASLLYGLVVTGVAGVTTAQAQTPRPRPEILSGQWKFLEARPAA